MVELGGAIPVPLSFTASDDELYSTLNKVNGVLFTGGGLTLVNNVTQEWHPYA